MRSIVARRAARALRRGKRRLLGQATVDEVDLVYRVVRRGPRGRVMLDVGGHIGRALEPFALDGWVVHTFEPDDGNRHQLERRWGRWPGVRIDARAVSDQEAAAVPFYRSKVSTGISGLTPFHPSHESARAVPVTTLAAYQKEVGLSHVDFLKVDAEGHDLGVLNGIPWDRIRPDIVLCEFDEGKAHAMGHGYRQLAELLVDHGYRVIVSEWYPIKEYGGTHRWRRFEVYPTALVDPAAWGNLIAAHDPATLSRLADETGVPLS